MEPLPAFREASGVDGGGKPRGGRASPDRSASPCGSASPDRSAAPGGRRDRSGTHRSAGRRSAAGPPASWPADLIRRTRHAYQQLAAQALEATGARAVTLARLDATRRRVTCIAFAAGPPALVSRTLSELARVAPGYKPQRYALPVDLNPDCLAAFTSGAAILWPFGRIAAGQPHGEALDVFRDVLGFRYTLHLPVHAAGQVVGALDFEFARRPGVRATATAQAFARLVDAATGNARLSQTLHQQVEALRAAQGRVSAAEDRVRAAVAEMLHGQVQGRLLAARGRLDEVAHTLRDDPDRAAELVAALAADLDCIREQDVRQASRMLHPTVIGAGLLPALAVLAERLGPCLRVAVEVAPGVAALDDPLASRLDGRVRLAAYRVAEEALGNIVRHAGVPEATLRLGVAGGRGARCELLVEVADGGRGFDLAAAGTRPGLGLAAVRDRVAQAGGRLQVRSVPGRGTTVSARLPVGAAVS